MIAWLALALALFALVLWGVAFAIFRVIYRRVQPLAAPYLAMLDPGD